MITAEEVKKLASLARLEVVPEEAEKLRSALNPILDYVGQINELEIRNPKSETGSQINNLRNDGDPHPSGEFTETLLSAAPDQEGNYFKVKKILTRE